MITPSAIRQTAFAMRVRDAHRAGRPILLVVEGAALMPMVAVLAWTALTQSTAAIAATFVLATVGAGVLVFVAWLMVPEDVPRTPSWFEAQRAAQARGLVPIPVRSSAPDDRPRSAVR